MKTQTRTLKIDQDLNRRVNAAMGEQMLVLFERETVINALWVGLIGQLHVVMLGGAGLGKSMAATEKYGSYADAETIALRQVYVKASRGYRMQEEKFAFTAPRRQFEAAINDNNPLPLIATRNMARNGSAFVTQQQTASKHYDGFIEQAKALMERAMTQSVIEIFNDWQSLQEAWAELDHKHSTAQVTIELTAAMLQAQLAAS